MCHLFNGVDAAFVIGSGVGGTTAHDDIKVACAFAPRLERAIG